MLSLVARILMISDVIPRPAVKSAGTHAADVVGWQIFADLVPLICAHPKLVCAWPKRDADSVANSPGVNLLSAAVRIKLEDPRAIFFHSLIRHIRARADRHVHFFAIWREDDVARPVTAAAQQPSGREMCRELLGRSARFEIAITIQKSNHAISIRDVQKLRVVAWWIKSDPEWFVQTAFCKSFSHIRFAIAVGIAQRLDLIGSTLYNEDVAIRCAEQESRIAKSSRVQFDFEPRWDFELRFSWPVYDTRPINREDIRTWRRQILNRDLARDAGRIACPITHCGFACEERAFFSGRASYDGDEKKGREKDYAENCTARLASLHLRGIVRAPNIARIRIVYRESMSRNGATTLVFFKTGTIENA